jgi:hypothetical protein
MALAAGVFVAGPVIDGVAVAMDTALVFLAASVVVPEAALSFECAARTDGPASAHSNNVTEKIRIITLLNPLAICTNKLIQIGNPNKDHAGTNLQRFLSFHAKSP